MGFRCFETTVQTTKSEICSFWSQFPPEGILFELVKGMSEGMKPLEQLVPKNPSAPTVPASDLHTLPGGFDLPELPRISPPVISEPIFAATSTLSIKDMPFLLGLRPNPAEHDPFHGFPSAWLRCVGDLREGKHENKNPIGECQVCDRPKGEVGVESKLAPLGSLLMESPKWSPDRL